MGQRIGRLFILTALLLVPSLGEAATRTLNCSAGTISAFLPRLRSGDTLLVSGTCNENVIIGAGRNNITLDGQGTATINGSAPSANTVLIRGHNVTIKGFTITGGSRGILIQRGGAATIDGNNIHSTGSDGVLVSDGSSARIVNNQIHDNPDDGIIVNATASANIGVLTGSDTTASPNTIQNNVGNGITVNRGSSARIIQNTISGNTGSGILVNDNSTADTASNLINGNGNNGIDLLRNSSVRLGRDGGVGLFDSPNSTTVNNVGNGIRCRVEGSVDGQVGTLNGSVLNVDIAAGCNNSTIP